MFAYYFLLILIGIGVVVPIGKILASCPHLPTLPNTVLKCIVPQNDRIVLCPGPGNLSPKGTIAYFQCSEDSLAFFSESNGLGFLRCNEDGKWSRLSNYYNLKCTHLDPNQPKIECGASNFLSSVPLISYGEEADITDWPWFSALFEYYDDEWQFICGGSLINPIDQHLVVLTAAHCLIEVLDETKLRVVLSPRSSDFLTNKQNPKTRENVYQVDQFEIHRNYSPENNHENDIGIIKLRGKIKLNQNVMPACWPAGQDDLEQFAEKSRSAILIGFGRDESGELSKRLKRSLMPVYTSRKCSSIFNMKTLDTQFCAGYHTGAAACKGDSGSGLSFRNPVTGRFFVQGIVSIGFVDRTLGTCENVAVYTRVSKFFSWIETITVRMNPKIPISSNTTATFSPPFVNSPQTHINYPDAIETITVSTVTMNPKIPISSTTVTKFNPPTVSSSKIPTYHPGAVETITVRMNPISTTSKSSSIPIGSQTPVYYPGLVEITTGQMYPKFSTTTGTINSTTSSTPIVNSSQAPVHYPEYASLAEKLHNCYRSRHGAPEVTLNATLNSFAKTWAEYLHRQGSLQSKSSMDYVTNEFATIYDSPDPDVNIRKAVIAWYNQMDYYQWAEPKPNAFSLMVWETVKTIGVSVVTVGSKTITVAAYSPPGNVIYSLEPTKYFKEKVLPLRNSHICSNQ